MWAATEARAAGRGGISVVARATGIAYSTIVRGLKELASGDHAAGGRERRPGGGRKRTIDKDPTLLADLEALVDPTAAGDPESPLRWTAKSVRQLAAALQVMGHAVSRQLVSELLVAAGYSLQANRKTREGPQHADRDAQFRYINQQVRRCQATAQPVISVDTKKKELVGDFKNAGRQWRPTGRPTPVRVHDFLIPERGKAIPDGVYDLTRNAGWVSVGIDHDTATFAVRTIGRWWSKMGQPRYPRARSLLSRPTPAAAMGRACACGSGSCSGWPIARAWRSPSVTSRPGPANGTRSSIGSFPTSAATGGASPS
jgi:Rhodopirellula transposase DDE domain